MKKKSGLQFLQDYARIMQKAQETNDGERCMVAPHPKLKTKLTREFRKLQDQLGSSTLRTLLKPQVKTRLGFNDSLVLPGDEFPLGTTLGMARGLGATRKPLQGKVRVLVVMVDFDDKKMTKKKQHFEDLFFSEGVIPTGSVREYFNEVSNGKVKLEGEVVGTYRMPLTMKEYAGNGAGIDNEAPNTRTLCQEAAVAAEPDVDFSKYDNDGNGFVDAFVVVHAGKGSEETGDNNDLWSHKWLLTKSFKTDNTKVYSYLTVPENCTIGVCAHELGHLLFGFPDLYDDDMSSEGLGTWCLMASGSWNNGGKTPAHPCAWCKGQQDWVEIVNIDTNREAFIIEDVKNNHTIYRMWNEGGKSKEYFLLEHRMKEKFDKYLPGEGLLIYHIDDTVDSNSNEDHYRVALMQADGEKHLEKGKNQGDEGDAWPGKKKKDSFNAESKPDSKSYGNIETHVAVNNIQLMVGKIRADLEIRKESAEPLEGFRRRRGRGIQ